MSFVVKKQLRTLAFSADRSPPSRVASYLGATLIVLATCSTSLHGASEMLSSRSVNTKYGALRGLVVHFKSQSPLPTSPQGHQSSGATVSHKPTSDTASTSGRSSASASARPSESARAPLLRPVEVFLGVPYATPPVGSLRFMPPVSPARWRGIKLTNKFRPVCPQRIPEAGYHGQSSPSSKNYTTNTTPSSRKTSSSILQSDQLYEFRLGHLMRYIPYIRNQSEDCLYLNIYVPFGTSK